jgi:hypothetical protein
MRAGKQGERSIHRSPGQLNGLLQEDDRRENGDGKDQHDPFNVIALEPASEMQNQNYDCDGVKGVKKHYRYLP